MKNGLVLVTGASSGIGYAIANDLARRGYLVLAGVRSEADASRIKKSAPESLTPLLLDVTKARDIDNAVSIVAEIAGDTGLQALVNNAGINCTGPFEHTSDERSRHLMDVNFFGAARLSREMIPFLRKFARIENSTSKIVNVGSIGSLIGVPWEAYYHASKFAILGLSESLRLELHAQDIRVSTVMPGGIKTPFIGKSVAGFEKAATALDAEASELYAEGLRRMAKTAHLVDRLGSTPYKVALKVAAILRQRNPALRHLVGADARMMRFMSASLPQKWFQALLRPTFGA